MYTKTFVETCDLFLSFVSYPEDPMNVDVFGCLLFCLHQQPRTITSLHRFAPHRTTAHPPSEMRLDLTSNFNVSKPWCL